MTSKIAFDFFLFCAILPPRMKEFLKKTADFFRAETVLSVAIILAFISAFFVHPDKLYISYINWRVLAILTGLILVMEGYKHLGIFSDIAGFLIRHVKNDTGICMMLIGLCFFFSMFLTNDVALITFVPLTIELMTTSGKKHYLIPVTVMQTVAANLGSMLTPIGNPQNLYLYYKMNDSVPEFLMLMLPLTAASAVLIVLTALIWIKIAGKGKDSGNEPAKTGKRNAHGKKKILLYSVLFILNILTVLYNSIPWYVPLTITVIAAVIADGEKRVLKTDYSLIFTFIAFFIFVGNMSRIPALAASLESLLEGRELMVSALLSQVISNVPCVILLSGFTGDLKALLYGCDIGGLGTLIASMASLISYKYIAMNDKKARMPYFIRFTAVNVLFLIPLYLFALMLL